MNLDDLDPVARACAEALLDDRGWPTHRSLSLETVVEIILSTARPLVVHELAEQIRNADYPAHASDGAEYAADLIDPGEEQR